MQVFTNLIANAVKYSDKADRQIEIGALPTDPPTVYVRDNGIGIDPRHADNIFRMFKRLHGRDRYGGGSGAGLTIVRKIVERHGGRIWVESTPGEGSTFYFTLAPAPTASPPVPVLDAPKVQAGGEAGAAPSRPVPGRADRPQSEAEAPARERLTPEPRAQPRDNR
jgi:hypothetical protein